MPKYAKYYWTSQHVGTIEDPGFQPDWYYPESEDIDITPNNSTCNDAINAFLALPNPTWTSTPGSRYLNPTFQTNCQLASYDWLSNPMTIGPTIPVVGDYESSPVSYDPVKASDPQYEVLNNGTLSVSTTETINGRIKLNKGITVFEKDYFNNLIDVRIHELLPDMPERWPKEPPVFRQVWERKAGPGGWPSGPEITGTNNVPNMLRSRNKVLDRDDYYNTLLPTNVNPPSNTIIDSYGPVTSNNRYPYPPGILCYNVAAYIDDASNIMGGIVRQGAESLGKYVVLYEDRPLFVADAYNFKVDSSEEMTEEKREYGSNAEVEKGLKYEWIVDGKTVSTNKYYQLWDQARPHGDLKAGAPNASGPGADDRRDAWSPTTITVTLIVKNKIGSVSTNISYVVWGGLGNLPDFTLVGPLDIGADSKPPYNASWTHPSDVNHLFWGTPFWKNEDRLGAPIFNDPWGSYYTWDDSLPPWTGYDTTYGPKRLDIKGQVVVEGDQQTGQQGVGITYPRIIFMSDNNGEYDGTSTNYGLGLVHKPIIGSSSEISVLASPSNGNPVPIPNEAGPVNLSARMDETRKDLYGGNLDGFLNFWTAEVRGYDPVVMGATLPAGLYEGGIPKWGFRSVWVRPPSAEEVANGATVNIVQFECYQTFTTGMYTQVASAHLWLRVPAGLPTTNALNGQGVEAGTWNLNPMTNSLMNGHQKWTATQVNTDGYVMFDITSTDFEYYQSVTNIAPSQTTTTWDTWNKSSFRSRLE